MKASNARRLILAPVIAAVLLLAAAPSPAQVVTVIFTEDFEGPGFTAPFQVDGSVNFANWVATKTAVPIDRLGPFDPQVFEINASSNRPWTYRSESDSGPAVGWFTASGSTVMGKQIAPGNTGGGFNGNDSEHGMFFGTEGRFIDFTVLNSVTLKFDAAFTSAPNNSRDQHIFLAFRQGYSTSMEANLGGSGNNDRWVGLEITNSNGGVGQGVIYDVNVVADDGNSENDGNNIGGAPDPNAFQTGNTGNISSSQHLFSGGGAGPTMDKNGQIMSFEVTWSFNPATMGMEYAIVATSTGAFNLNTSGAFFDTGPGGLIVGPPGEPLDILYIAFERYSAAWVDNIEISVDTASALPAFVPREGTENLIEIYFQDPNDPLRNDGDADGGGEGFGLSGVSAPYNGLDGTIMSHPDLGGGLLSFDGGVNPLLLNEDPQISQDGILWGGYNAALTGDWNGGSTARFMTLDNKINSNGGISIENYAFRDFDGASGSVQADNTWTTINGNEGITENTGSYYYTLFNKKAVGPFGNPDNLSFIRDSINLDPADVVGGDPAIYMGWNITDPVPDTTEPENLAMFNFLIQTNGNPDNDTAGQWYKSQVFSGVDQNWGNVPDESSTFAEYVVNLQRYPVASMTWVRVGAAAETDMNQMDWQGAVALGVPQGGTTPNLKNVTGFGWLLGQLMPRADADVELIAIVLEGLTGTPTPTPTPTPPPTEVSIALETWDSVTGFSPAALPGDGAAVVGSDLSFVAHAGGANLADIQFNTVGGSIRMQRVAVGDVATPTSPAGIDLVALGSLFKAPVTVPTVASTTEQIRLSAEIFFGAATGTASANASFTLGVGDDIAGDFVTGGGDNLVPGSMIGGSSLAMEVSNEIGAPRLNLRINDPFGTTLSSDNRSSAGLGLDATAHNAAVTSYAGQNGTAWNDGAAGHTYEITALFVRGDSPDQTAFPGLGPFDTVVSYAITGTGPIDAGAIGGDITALGGITFVGAVVVPTSFGLNREFNQVFVRVGSDFGAMGGSDDGSWADNLDVRKQGNPAAALPVPSDTWMIYNDPPPGR